MKPIFIPVLLVLCFCCLLQTISKAKPKQPETQNETIIIETLPPITAANVRQRVESALAKAKKLDFSEVSALTGAAPLVAPVIFPLANNDNDEVSHVVVSVASEIHTPEAVKVLSTIAAYKSSSAASEAVSKLYERDRIELKLWGGSLLKENLLIRLKEVGVEAQTLLLLSCFADDPKVTDYVKSLLPRRENIAFGDKFAAGINVAADIVLSEVDESATQRTLKRIGDVPFNIHLFVLAALRHSTNKTILLKVLVTLEDKRPVTKVGFYYESEYARVCDFAVELLWLRFDKTVRFDPFPPIYTDAELEKEKVELHSLIMTLG